MVIKIRKFMKKDAEECSEIVKACIKNARNLTKKAKEDIRKKSSPKKLIEKSKTRDYFVCEKNGKIIAIGGLKKNEVIRMYTHPKFQSKGIGSKILKEIEKQAMKKKMRKLFLYTHPKASKFYLKNKYNLVKKYKNKGISVVHMEKVLK